MLNVNAAERVTATVRNLRFLMDGIQSTVSGAQSELDRLRAQNQRLLTVLKDLDAAIQAPDEKDKTLAHYAALALISELAAA